MDEEDIIGYVKRRKFTKAERIQSIQHGREETSVGLKKTGGLSNLEKNGAKPFMLTKHREKVKKLLFFTP